MRIYDITTVLKKHDTGNIITQKDTIILADNDSLKEHIQMLYGCWYDIISFEFEKANMIHISKNYIAQEAMKIIRFD